jgi:hypothetical protein
VHVPLRERPDVLETALRGRVDEVGEGVHEHLDGTREALYRSVTESTAAVGASVDKASETLHGRFTQAHDALAGKLAETGIMMRDGIDDTKATVRAGIDAARDHVVTRIDESRAALDPTDRLVTLTERLEQVTSRLDAMAARLDAVESGIGGRLGELSTSVEQGLQQVRGTVSARPDTDSLVSLVRDANEESAQRRPTGRSDGHVRRTHPRWRWTDGTPAAHGTAPAAATGEPTEAVRQGERQGTRPRRRHRGRRLTFVLRDPRLLDGGRAGNAGLLLLIRQT